MKLTEFLQNIYESDFSDFVSALHFNENNIKDYVTIVVSHGNVGLVKAAQQKAFTDDQRKLRVIRAGFALAQEMYDNDILKEEALEYAEDYNGWEHPKVVVEGVTATGGYDKIEVYCDPDDEDIVMYIAVDIVTSMYCVDMAVKKANDTTQIEVEIPTSLRKQPVQYTSYELD